MAFEEIYHSSSDVVKDLAAISDIIAGLKRTIASSAAIAYESQDARLVALDGIQRDIIANGYWINAGIGLRGVCEEKFQGSWQGEYEKRLGTNLGFERTEGAMLDYLRNTLVVSIHFKIENLFKNLLREKDGVSPSMNMEDMSKSVLELAGLRPEGREMEVLRALRYMRNSYHSNGVHSRGKDLTLNIDGTKFEFTLNRPVKCNSWKHLTVLVKASIEALKAILLSGRVSEWRRVIRDDFVSTVSP